MHEAYQILRAEADNKRIQRKKQRELHGLVTETEEEEKAQDETENENCQRDDFGIMQSTAIPLDFGEVE